MYSYKALTRMALYLNVIRSHSLRRVSNSLNADVEDILCQIKTVMFNRHIPQDIFAYRHEFTIGTYTEMLQFTCSVLKGSTDLLDDIRERIKAAVRNM